MTYWKSVLIFLIAAAASAQASLLYYWDFNVDTEHPNPLVPTIGSASASLTFSAIGLGTWTSGTGTAINIVNGYANGDSLAFVDIVDGFSNHELTFENLDFSNLSDVQISFAVRSTEFFEIADTFTYEYRVSAGDSWSTPISWTKPTDTWGITTLFLPDLAGASAAEIRIRSTAIFSVNSVLEFDNVQITAVPEPSAITLSVAAGLLIVTLVLRRRQSAQ